MGYITINLLFLIFNSKSVQKNTIDDVIYIPQNQQLLHMVQDPGHAGSDGYRS